MKPKFLIIIAIYLLCFSGISNQKAQASNNLNRQDSIKILSSPDLYNLTSSWVREYSKVNPQLAIKVCSLKDSPISDFLNSDGNLCFISNEYYSSLNNESIWRMVVGTDAIVPIINSKNPFLAELEQQGISPEKISRSLAKPENQNWKTLLANEQNIPVNYYTLNNESIKTDVIKFLEINPEGINRISIESVEGMILAIQKDPYAIGFCKITSILDVNNQAIVQGIRLLPIDKNGNGKMDYNEKIYADLNSFLHGVWIGKYPKALCKNIYSISSNKPSNEREIAFLTWVLTDGQKFLNPYGFGDLAYSQRQTNIDNLYSKEIGTKASNNRFIIPIALLVLVAFTALFFIVDSAVQRLRHKKTDVADATSVLPLFFDERSVIVPNGLYFDKSHTWAFMEKNGIVGIGIDDFLQHVTGPITRINMKNSGEKIQKGEPFLTLIQKGKQLNLKAPISGTIKKRNENLLTNASILNSSPYSEGWIYMIEPTNWLRDIQFLIIAQGYKEWLKMEFLHLKDFLAITVRANYPEDTQIVLQDGGGIKNGILEDLKPEIWEDFQTHFLDSSK